MTGEATVRAIADLFFRKATPRMARAELSPARATPIDPEQVHVVQLSDFLWQSVRTGGSDAPARTRYRVFPGEGAHGDELAAFVGKLDALGYAGIYSLDVANDDYQQMPADAVAARARRSAEWLEETVLRRALPVPNMEHPGAP